MRKPLIVGNWKMNGSRESVRALLLAITASETLGCDRMVCPPFVFMDMAAGLVQQSGVGLSAQNLESHEAGAFTGEISAAMLADFGCSHTLVGHSERRELFGETDEVVAAKCVAALDGGLVPILCVGETLAERESGETESVILRQVNEVMKIVGVEGIGRSIVAYEPVWAIGTGKSATAEEAEAVHKLIRNRLAEESELVGEKVRILYGGSVKPENAKALFAMKNIDGALVGGASLDANAFLAICDAAAR